jgi:hypothetical protein
MDHGGHGEHGVNYISKREEHEKDKKGINLAHFVRARRGRREKII